VTWRKGSRPRVCICNEIGILQEGGTVADGVTRKKAFLRRGIRAIREKPFVTQGKEGAQNRARQVQEGEVDDYVKKSSAPSTFAINDFGR